MPAQPPINLIDKPEFENTSMGQILEWAVTYGRYIMIGTEIIVLLAFVSRFSLDRRLTDLREEIAQKQLILKANQGFEDQFNAIQDTLVKIKTTIETQQKPFAAYTSIASALPQDVKLLDFEYVGNGKIDLSLLAGTQTGFARFLQSVQNNKLLVDVELSDVNQSPITGIKFHMSGTIK